MPIPLTGAPEAIVPRLVIDRAHGLDRGMLLEIHHQLRAGVDFVVVRPGRKRGQGGDEVLDKARMDPRIAERRRRCGEQPLAGLDPPTTRPVNSRASRGSQRGVRQVEKENGVAQSDTSVVSCGANTCEERLGEAVTRRVSAVLSWPSSLRLSCRVGVRDVHVRV
jgi:hypothetical protein